MSAGQLYGAPCCRWAARHSVGKFSLRTRLSYFLHFAIPCDKMQKSVRYNEGHALFLSAVARKEGTKRGYLSKKTAENSRWHEKFFTLYQNILFYSENEQSTRPAGIYLLEGCTCERAPAPKASTTGRETLEKQVSFSLNTDVYESSHIFSDDPPNLPKPPLHHHCTVTDCKSKEMHIWKLICLVYHITHGQQGLSRIFVVYLNWKKHKWRNYKFKLFHHSQRDAHVGYSKKRKKSKWLMQSDWSGCSSSASLQCQELQVHHPRAGDDQRFRCARKSMLLGQHVFFQLKTKTRSFLYYISFFVLS